MVPESLRRSFESYGGEVRTGTPVGAITCEGERVRGIELTDGTEITADVVVSACDPHATFLSWLRNPPARAQRLVRRWRAIPRADGYESKIDAVMHEVPRLSLLDDMLAERLGVRHGAGTTVIAPSLADMHRGVELMRRGEVLERPGLLVNVPTVVDPSMAPAGTHVLSLEALYTPYGLPGGWAQSTEPARWLDLFAGLCQPGWRDSVDEWRAMTPDRYERELHLPRGHAASFAGSPLAAIRNRNPELTRYETAVRGMYLTGAATFPGAGVWGASGRNAALTILRTA
jgi:phytoene dehydrogenase-like protein